MKLIKLTLVLSMIAFSSASFAEDHKQSKRELKKERRQFTKKVRATAAAENSQAYVARPKSSSKVNTLSVL